MITEWQKYCFTFALSKEVVIFLRQNTILFILNYRYLNLIKIFRNFAPMNKGILLFSLILLLFLNVSCSFSKLVKSNDSEKQYEKAVYLYGVKDYSRALQLFEKLAGTLKATDKAERVGYYTAYSYFYMKDYTLAAYYFRRYANNFPNLPTAEECSFMSAYCNYKNSPQYSLDQTSTREAIKDLQTFVNVYPKSPRVSESNDLIDELRAKLEMKDYKIGKMYYRMEDYLAAITAFSMILKEYPESVHREEILFLVFKSSYKYAFESIDSKKKERYQKATTAYNDLVVQFPQSKYIPEAKNMLDKIQKDIAVLPAINQSK